LRKRASEDPWEEEMITIEKTEAYVSELLEKTAKTSIHTGGTFIGNADKRKLGIIQIDGATKTGRRREWAA